MLPLLLPELEPLPDVDDALEPLLPLLLDDDIDEEPELLELPLLLEEDDDVDEALLLVLVLLLLDAVEEALLLALALALLDDDEDAAELLLPLLPCGQRLGSSPLRTHTPSRHSAPPGHWSVVWQVRHWKVELEPHPSAESASAAANNGASRMRKA